MTPDKPPERRQAYAVTSFPHVTQVPAASLHSTPGYPPIGVIRMGEFEMHVHDAAQAREIAAAFTRAAELLDAGGECPDCGALAPGHQLTCKRIPAGPGHDAGSEAPGD